MTSSLRILWVAGLLATMAACFTPRTEADIIYYRGQNVPGVFIRLLNATETEVEFLISLGSIRARYLYHVLLVGNTPLAEGAFPTWPKIGKPRGYRVTLKLEDGPRLEYGKTYRLCIGKRNPELHYYESSKYRCIAEYEFVFE